MKKRVKYPMPPKQPSYGKRAVKKEVAVLTEQTEILKKAIKATQEIHSMHIAALSNFLGHDMKNSIQNMDTVLTSYKANEITDEHLDSLRAQLSMIREVMNNFSQLIPHGKHGVFRVNSLIGATEALIRPTLTDKGIRFTKELLSHIDLQVNYPFHSLLQVFTNLIINACNHLQDKDKRSVLFKIDIDQTSHNLFFSIYDTGSPTHAVDVDKIFEYGYSTTQGTGIGLFHARYICELLHGSIVCTDSDKPDFSKRFLITLPFKSLDNE